MQTTITLTLLKIDEKIALMKAQTELSDYIIERWKEKEKKKIDENPEDFIKYS